MRPKEIPDELIDQLLVGHEGPEAITGPDGLLKQLTKRVVERATSAELRADRPEDRRLRPLPDRPARWDGAPCALSPR